VSSRDAPSRPPSIRTSHLPGIRSGSRLLLVGKRGRLKPEPSSSVWDCFGVRGLHSPCPSVMEVRGVSSRQSCSRAVRGSSLVASSASRQSKQARPDPRRAPRGRRLHARLGGNTPTDRCHYLRHDRCSHAKPDPADRTKRPDSGIGPPTEARSAGHPHTTLEPWPRCRPAPGAIPRAPQGVISPALARAPTA
jgi:hypothetical protein